MQAPADKRDYNKFCKIHNDHEHRTEGYVSLWYAVISFLKKEHLRNILTKKGRYALEKGKQNKDHESKAIETPEEPPNVEKVIGVIHGGSKVSKLTKLATKRYANELNSVNSTSIQPTPTPQDY